MRALIATLICALAGCTTPDAGPRPVAQTTCDASNWSELIGQPEEALYGALGNLRVIKPGQPITKDFNPDRLNAEIGADGRIKRFGCY